MKACLCRDRTDIRCDEQHCDIAGPGKPGDSNECRVCWLRLGGKPEQGRAKGFGPKPCLHLGAATGETRPCTVCNGTVQVPIHGCGVHGECTLDHLLPRVACCRICSDRETQPAA